MGDVIAIATATNRDPSLLEKELQTRKARLERTKAELQAQFAVYTTELACVATLEQAFKQAVRLH